MRIKFLKPRVDEGGVALDVFLPTKNRSILPEGENVVVDAYIEARIRKGSLVVVEADEDTKETKEITNEHSI